ncbi:hypothetical protein VTN00DRAFT_4741 [Thermoascus crustaceus]|uniref:uncharacterized protein n=1 Tax=Thermoascus crustaceus TaxID=5088 RepID=UPI003742C4BE
MFGDKPFVDHHTEAGFVLLPLEKALELVGIYFDFSIVTYRFLHRGAVERWVREVYENNNVSSPMNLPSSSGRTLVARAAIVFMVFAVATMHEERRPGSTCATTGAGGDGDCEECNESERWYIASKHMSSLETGPPKLETLQARLGQCLYLLSSSRANECWYAFGTALQLVTALGLHRKRATTMKLGQTGTTTAYLEHELRKRVFWSAYTIDKYLSVMFGRPRLLHDEDIDQELPDVVDDDDIVMDSSPEPEMGVGLGLGLERQFSRHRQRQEVESADCLMIAANLHFRLARILSEISRQVYTIRPSSKSSASPLEAALHLTSELEKWKESVPPIFSSVRASSLIPPLCRQSHVLQLAYSHAVIHATRSFLLSDFTTAFGNRRGRGEEGGGGSTVTRDKVKIHVQKCISAAKDVMTLVVSLADQGILVQSFWFTHYVCFCAIIVVYIYTIQEYRRRPFLGTASAPSDDETATRSLFNLAESCQQHLAKATRRNCPSRRYSIILEELRVEVHRWIAAHDLRRSATGVGTDTAERITLRGAQHGVTVSERQQKASAPLETENQHPVSLESGNRPNHTPIPMPGELQLQAPVLEAIDDSGKVHDLNLVLPENWEESSTWWTQLDSWALSSIGNDASMFTF